MSNSLISDKIRVLIVDDSAFMRKAISNMLASDPMIEVVDSARNGEEGVEKVLSLSPDIVTMDIEMPKMDGITALKEIMRRKPTPVIMISSLTKEGAEATLEALNAGAVDFIPKELSFVSLDIVKIKNELLEKIKTIVSKKIPRFKNLKFKSIEDIEVEKTTTQKPLITPPTTSIFTKRDQTSSSTTIKSKTNDDVVENKESVVTTNKHQKKLPKSKDIKLIVLGVSTGGPPALQKVIPMLPKNLPVPLTIVQHMPPLFTKSLAERLNGLSEISVKEAEEDDILEAGMVYIAPGDRHLKYKKIGNKVAIHLSEHPMNTLHKPSVDVMMLDAVTYFSSNLMGVIMTGMGKDGLQGMMKIDSVGGPTIAQNEDTCVVYGMPRVVVEAGAADEIVPLESIAETIVKILNKK